MNRYILLLAGMSLSMAASRVEAQQLYGIDQGTGDLYRISTADASLNLVGSTGVTGIGSLEYRGSDGLLYGFTLGSTSTLYKIDPSDASTVSVGSLGIGFVFEGGLAIASDGTAFGTNQNSASVPVLFTVDLDDGSAATVGTISGGAHDIDGLGVRSDGKLVGLDRETNSLLEIDPVTANSAVISAVTPTVGAIGGMSLVDDVGLFSTAGPGGSIPGSNELYSFDPFTGTHALIGNFDATITGDGIGGIAMLPIPEPSTLLLACLGLALLYRFTRRS